jgi:LysM repeat protein
VVGGDTLFNISRRYNVSVADLKSYNNLSDNTVKLGQVIRVKPNPLASNTMLAEAVPAPPRRMKHWSRSAVAQRPPPVQFRLNMSCSVVIPSTALPAALV